MDDSDQSEPVGNSSARGALCYGDTIDVFHVGRVKIVQRYACIRRDQFEWTTSAPFPSAFRDYLATRGTVRGSAALYILDVPHAFQITVAPNAGRAVFVPRLATELEWQKKVVTEIVSALDDILHFV
jgi:hypothetical protein